jgi:predicted amidohydrolase
MRFIFASLSLILICLPARSLAALGPDRSTTWTARPGLEPNTRQDDQDRIWVVSGNGKPMRHGGWDLHWDSAKAGHWYRFEVICEATDISSIQDNAHAELIFWKTTEKRSDWRHVSFKKLKTNRYRFSTEALMPAGSIRCTARLMLRWTGAGELKWSEPRLKEIAAPPERKIKVAIITGKPPGTGVKENMEFTEKLIREAAAKHAQVICLPEVITSWRIKGEPGIGARPIPGAETKSLERLAHELGVDINLSMNEIDTDGLIYNTAIYVDRDKGIVGKYRKVHLAVGERWKGITPGEEFPVWQTRFGRAGMLVCYDNVHPEGHRILSQKGAEVIFLPIMGDPRAVGNRAYEKWLQIMSVRAMDNHVWMVVCQNNGDRGVIVRPDGEVMAEVDPGNGFAMAEIDLNFRHASWIGSDFLNRNWGERRPAVYRRLSSDQ